MGKHNEKKYKFELKAGCVNCGGSATIEIVASGHITPIDKLRLIARTFDAMVETDTRYDRGMIAGILYTAMMEKMSAGEYLEEILRMSD